MAKRRSNGEGNIRKRKDGRWEGRYTAGHDPVTGKQVFKRPPDGVPPCLSSRWGTHPLALPIRRRTGLR